MIWLNLLKRYWYIIPLVAMLGYHYVTVNSLEKKLLEAQKDYVDVNASYYRVLKINSDNLTTIQGLKDNLKEVSTSKDIIIEKKNSTIESMNKILNETKKVKYQHIYTYDKCEIKVKGDSNESTELYRTLNSIGK